MYLLAPPFGQNVTQDEDFLLLDWLPKSKEPSLSNYVLIACWLVGWLVGWTSAEG